MLSAYSIRVRGVVQGVGFRPFVYQLAHANRLTGWVLNGEEGLEIHIEGQEHSVQELLKHLREQPPSGALISALSVLTADVMGFTEFTIQNSRRQLRPTVRITPDLCVCEDCLRELFDSGDRRYAYPYINCTNCGPRYSVVRGLPYDRSNTTMADWPLDRECSCEYADPGDRRFHAQPVACPACGPHFYFLSGNEIVRGDGAAVGSAAQHLHDGEIVAVKGIGGYHLACDAANSETVSNLRSRKYRKEKPFALMASNLEVVHKLVDLTPEAEALLTSVARPIVLAPAKVELLGVTPESNELGVMLPYTPLHHLLFAAGAPEVLLMTSANRSNEPIAYRDEEALQQLTGIADAFLIGGRPIARRLDDSVVRAGVFGPAVLRRSRGYAPGAVATLPTQRPILALGADLKNTITLVVDGQAFVSQHIGDLNHYEAFRAFRESIEDLLSMYEIKTDELLVVHDAHPQYLSTNYASGLAAAETLSVQHHRAHIASVIAERGAWDQRVIGVSFDGTGYGDDGTIWGGEIFVGSLSQGFERVAHLRPAALPGGDAAASLPVQAAAGYLAQLSELPDLNQPPFSFPRRYSDASRLVRSNLRTFPTTSMGRLFDTVAALLGFTRATTFEGQAAMWLEQLARRQTASDAYPFPFRGGELDFRPLLQSIVLDRRAGREPGEIARAFHLGVAGGLHRAVTELCGTHGADVVALSGGVFQNELLLSDLKASMRGQSLQIWTNRQVPSNDGGISLGQSALAALGTTELACVRRDDHSEVANA